METENQIPLPIATPTPEERASALLRAAEGLARKAEDERHARAMASLGEEQSRALATVKAIEEAIVTELARHKAAGEEIAGAAIARIEAALKASPLAAPSEPTPAPAEKPKVTRRRLSADEVKRAKELVLDAIRHFGGTCSTGDIVDRVAHLSDSERAAGLRVLVAEGLIHDASVKVEGKKVKAIWRLGPAPGAPTPAAAPAAPPADGGAA